MTVAFGTSIDELPAVITRMVELAGGPAPVRPQLRHLRRKPGRGLVAVYRLGRPGPALACLRASETAMAGPGLRRSPDDLVDGGVEGAWPGVLRLASGDLSLLAFPEDDGLPALAEVTRMAPGGPAFAAVRDGLRKGLGDPSFAPEDVVAAAIRYKPSERCVLRFTARPGGQTVVGKVYADAHQATAVHRLMEQLFDVLSDRAAAGPRDPSPLPRPLALVPELGFSLSDDLARGASVVAGTAMLRPARPSADSLAAARAAARTLAALHACPLPAGCPPRTAADEAARARSRARRLADYAPAVADGLEEMADRIAAALAASGPAPVRVSHGSFKPAQLLFRGGGAYLTDFDQLCAADPALDVGYFLAYLRPSTLWYRRGPGPRAWYDAHERAFVVAYARAAAALGTDDREAEQVVARSHLFSAGLLLKIAGRRPNRMNAVRRGELEAMLEEVARCVGRASGQAC